MRQAAAQLMKSIHSAGTSVSNVAMETLSNSDYEAISQSAKSLSLESHPEFRGGDDTGFMIVILASLLVIAGVLARLLDRTFKARVQ
jgi:hypothetical protein